jgi:hypothetical protein
MFSPSASMMYSSAMSMMRTQELPNCWATNGKISKPISTNAILA